MSSVRPIGIEDLGPYQVYSRREIITLLRSIKKANQLVRMTFHDGSESIVTSILDVDEAQSWVIVDCAQSKSQNQRALDSNNISFETLLDRIRILFFTTRLDTCLFEEQPAFRFALPASLIRLQRREFYRVRTPRSPILVNMETEDGMIEVKTYLQDLSAGGVGLLDDHMRLDNTIGRVYENCSITLADKNVVVASLQVRNSQDIPLASGRVVRRLGCQFVGLPKKSLMALQRFITKIERETNAKLLGL